MYQIKTGNEHGVTWKIDSMGVNPIKISVEKENSSEGETIEHSLLYPNCSFGYDAADVAQVENKLEALIIKYANDGYNGTELREEEE